MTLRLDRLVDLPDNPLPQGAELVRLRTIDGVTLRAAWFTPPQPVGTILLFQGRSEFIERYLETIDELMQRGFAVFAFDWRGQGGSMRELADPAKGHIDDFLLYLRDVEAALAWLAGRAAPQPWHGLAHSMGGAILTLALARGENRLARAAASAPMIGIHAAPLGGWGEQTARLLSLIGLGGMYVPFSSAQVASAFAPFEGNVLTSDPMRYERSVSILTAAPELGIGAPTISWIAAAFRLMREMADPEFGLQLRVPLLYILAGGDRVVDTPAAELLAARLRGAAAVTITGAQHEILNERDPFRAEFWAAFDAFIRPEA